MKTHAPKPSAPHPFERVLCGGLLLYFFGKALFFALNIRENLFPDEITHWGLVELFSHSFLPPSDSPDSYPLGLISHKPMLYYFLFGKFIHLNIFGASDLVFARVGNVLLAFVNVFYSWKITRLVIKDWLVRVLVIALLTNTLMFTFISASVNYDNLNNACAVLSLYFLVLFLRTKSPNTLLALVLVLLAGMLTKTSFLPYAFAISVVLSFHHAKEIGAWLPGLKSLFIKPKRTTIGLLVGIALLGSLNLNLYGMNLIRYQKLVPETDQVLSLDHAMENRIFARNYITAQYQNGTITAEQASGMASEIKHAGDQNDTLYRLRSIANEKARPRTRMDRFTYFFSWATTMTGRIYGVAAHKIMWRSTSSLLPYLILFTLALAGLIRGARPDDMEGAGKYILFIFFFYGLVLMQGVNYQTYLGLGVLGAGLQGRYLFPVLLPLYLWMAFYLAGSAPKPLRWAVSAGVAGFFIYAEMPWFLENVSDSWYF